MSYLSTPGMFETFLESIIWQDMCKDLDLWISDLRDILEDIEGVLTEAETNKIRGRIDALRNVKSLPQVALENITEDLEREKNKKEEDDA